MFVRPKDIKVGDFPPLDDFNEDEDEIWLFEDLLLVRMIITHINIYKSFK
jgi:hypothetical protein